METELGRDANGDPRIGFAAERTLLAWLRTGLAMMGFGFVVARFGLFLRELGAVEQLAPHRSGTFSFWAGTGLIVVGVLVNAAAAMQHLTTIRRLQRGDPWELRPSTLGIAVTAVLVTVGLILTAYLIITKP